MEETEQRGQTEETEQEGRKNRRRALIWALIVLAIIVAVVLFFLLRGCTSRTTSEDQTSGQPSGSLAIGTARGIENKVHAALHTKSLRKDTPLCSVVYIIEASNDNGIVATIRLNSTSAELVQTLGSGGPQRVATTCENAVIAGVPEVATVKVVDRSGALLGSATRK